MGKSALLERFSSIYHQFVSESRARLLLLPVGTSLLLSPNKVMGVGVDSDDKKYLFVEFGGSFVGGHPSYFRRLDDLSLGEQMVLLSEVSELTPVQYGGQDF